MRNFVGPSKDSSKPKHSKELAPGAAPSITTPEWELRLGDCFDRAKGLASLEAVDHVIVDPPYSARTHNGHNKSSVDTGRRCLVYEPWGEVDVRKACTSFGLARGWIVVMTDHVLAPIWEHNLKALGRYVFAPLPCVLTGSRVRMSGDGPSSWTTWLVVARTTALSKWGTLRGAYVMSRGERTYTGGKPLHLMEEIVRDYSRPGDLVCDPCAGSGTTGVAALRAGRRFIGWEHNIDAFAVARKALKAAVYETRVSIRP